jgi:diaminohydroxyphosphoribosylaminopyrimidine deaminase/5-amino-6-(5-phosphoribosylamino)uracil reductase
MTQTAEDRKWMRRAIALARRGEGRTRPNPPVGAVVVRGDSKLGEGFHRRAGEAHAEVVALDACRGAARGAALYVTLEPCCTHGRTPPCTDRILREGIARVVVGCRDENGCHCGRGLDVLAKRGVDVVYGVCEEEARDLTRPFFKHVTTGLPYVTVKLAMTLDGRIADREHRAKWITGAAARAEVQRLRRRADVMLVGAGTVCADDPSLLCRLRGAGGVDGLVRDTKESGASPAGVLPAPPAGLLRVVVDASGRTPAHAQVYTDAAAARTVVATTQVGAARKAAAWALHGAQVWTLGAADDGRVPLELLLKRLGAAGYLHVLCEGGGHLAGALQDAGLVDEYELFYAPALLGDSRAVGALEGRGTLLADVRRWRCVDVKRFGEDVRIRVRKA